MKGFLKVNKENIGIGFDVIIGSSSHIVNNPAIKVKRPEEAEKEIGQMMHNNSEDKYSSFINAHSRRDVVIDVPTGRSEAISILFLNSEGPLLSHVFINAGDNTNTKILELFASEGRGSMVGTIHEIRIGKRLQLRARRDTQRKLEYAAALVLQEQHRSDSKLKFTTFYNGSGQTRVRNVMCANGQRSEIR